MTTDAPSVAAEIQTRTAQRDRLAAFFRDHPMEVLFASDLEPVVGPNYRSRISDCRDELHMEIENVPQYREWTRERRNRHGRVRIVLQRQRLVGGYRYIPRPSAPLGRDAG